MQSIIIALAIIMFIALFFLNIHFASKSSNEDSNIYTTISGWVSGCATIVLGVIAILQGVMYRNATERVNYINELNWNIKQLDGLLCQINDITNIDQFLAEGLEYIHNLDNWKEAKIYDKVKANIRLKYIYRKKANDLSFLLRRINNDIMDISSKEELCEQLQETSNLLIDISDFYNNNDLRMADEIMYDIQKYSSLLEEKNNKILDMFNSFIKEYKELVYEIETCNYRNIKIIIDKNRSR